MEQIREISIDGCPEIGRGAHGIVFENLVARSSADYISESPEHFENYLKKSADLMKQIHSVTADPGELPDMKQQTLSWLPKVRPFLPDDLYARLRNFADAIPERNPL